MSVDDKESIFAKAVVLRKRGVDGPVLVKLSIVGEVWMHPKVLQQIQWLEKVIDARNRGSF